MALRGLTRPPPAVLLAVIGWLSATWVGLSALGLAWSLAKAARGESGELVAAVGFALSLVVSAWINRHVIAWWVRR